MALITYDNVIQLKGVAVGQGHAQHRTEFAKGTAVALSMSYGNALLDGVRSVGSVMTGNGFAAAAQPSVEQAAQPLPATGTSFARGNAGLDGVWTLQGAAVAQSVATGRVATSVIGLQALGALGADDSGYATGEAVFQPLGAVGESDVAGEPTYNMADLSLAYLTVSGNGLNGGLGEGTAALQPLGALGADDSGYAQAKLALQPLGTVGFEDFIDTSLNVLVQPASALGASGTNPARQGGVLAQPTTQIAAEGGWQFTVFAQPPSLLEATGTVPLLGRAQLTQPKSTLAISGAIALLGRAQLTQPASSIGAEGGWRLALTQPASSLAATGAVASLGRATLEQPRSDLVAVGINGLVGSALLEQPASALTETGLVLLVQPRLRLVASGALDVAEPVYGAYAVNLSNAGVTTYSDYPVQQVVRFRGEYYGIGPSGLFRLDSGLGDEAQIAVVLASGYTDFGQPLMKRMTHAYVVTNTLDNLTISALTGNNNPVRGQAAGKSSQAGVHTRRAKFGRGVKALSWGLKVEHVGAERIRIFSLEPLVEVLSRKVG